MALCDRVYVRVWLKVFVLKLNFTRICPILTDKSSIYVHSLEPFTWGNCTCVCVCVGVGGCVRTVYHL